MTDYEIAYKALIHISDWAKWLVTVATFAIGFLGSLFIKEKILVGAIGKLLCTFSIFCFGASICFASLLLLTIPEIIQTMNPSSTVWNTRDSIIGDNVGLNTRSIVVVQSAFFAVGVILGSVSVISALWKKSQDN